LKFYQLINYVIQLNVGVFLSENLDGKLLMEKFSQH